MQTGCAALRCSPMRGCAMPPPALVKCVCIKQAVAHHPGAPRTHSSTAALPAASSAEAAGNPAAHAASRSLTSTEVDVDTQIAYELVQGALVRWSHPSQKSPPTAVLVHGILGSRRNMASFAKMLVEQYPSWQVLLVDLRCHGDSAALPEQPEGPHTVHAAAADILVALQQLRLFPRVLIGHSFGGKVVMGMVQQFGQKLPYPVQVWVLDTLPGEARSGGEDGSDHPGALIELLRSLPMPATSRSAVIDAVVHAGFSPHIARWVVTNLRNARGSNGNGSSCSSGDVGDGNMPGLTWTFDLDGIAEMYRSYEETTLWPVLQSPPDGLTLDFVKAERSSFRWGGTDEQRIKDCGHHVHLLTRAGHWVHTDNPLGLFNILAPAFGMPSGMVLAQASSRRRF